MPIKFTCRCGRKLKVADAMAGRPGQCPSCGLHLLVPQSSDAYDEARFLKDADRPCPSCRKTMPSGAVVCVHCGYHRIAGTRIGTTEEEQREDDSKGWRLRVAGQRVPIWLVVVLLLMCTGFGFWYWQGPAQPVHLSNKQYAFVTDMLASGRTLSDGTRTVGGDDTLLVATPDDGGDFVLVDVALKQSIIRNQQQTAGYNSLISDSQFKLQPADGSAPLPVRLITASFSDKAVVNLGPGSTRDYTQLFPPIAPDELKSDEAQGFTEGTARWLAPRVMGDLKFSSVVGMGGTSNSGGASAYGNLRLSDPLNNVIDMQYNGNALLVDWPDDECTGYWATHRLERTSRMEGWYRHRFTLAFERPPTGGNHTLLYCDEPIATIHTSTPPPVRTPAPTPIRPTSPQQQAQLQAQANNPVNYLSGISRARQRGQGLVAASNINQFSIAIQMFVDERRRFPESLLELLDHSPDLKQVLSNPRTGDLPGYIYEPPPPGSTSGGKAHDTPILWESLAGQKDPDGAILYADFHME